MQMRNISEAFRVRYVDCERLLTLLLRQGFARGRCRRIACGLLNCQTVDFLQPYTLFPDVYLRYPFTYDPEGALLFLCFEAIPGSALPRVSKRL